MATTNLRAGARRLQFVFPIIAVLLSACAAQGEAGKPDAPSCSVTNPGAAMGGGAAGCTDGPEPRGM
jgi:hypothetical protein